MKTEMTINGNVKVALIPEDARDKALVRLAFDGNQVHSVDLREDGSLVFTLTPTQQKH